MWCSTKTTFNVYVSQWSQIQFEDEDHAVFVEYQLHCLRWEPQPVTLWLYPVTLFTPFICLAVDGGLQCKVTGGGKVPGSNWVEHCNVRGVSPTWGSKLPQWLWIQDIVLCLVQLFLTDDSCEKVIFHLQGKEASSGKSRITGYVDLLSW